MVTTTKKLTFAEYLKYNDGTDTKYELVNGELIPMSLGTAKHGAITKFLERSFDDEIARIGINWTAQKFTVGVPKACYHLEPHSNLLLLWNC